KLVTGVQTCALPIYGRYAIVTGEKTRLIDAATGNTLRVFSAPSSQAFFTGDNKTAMLAHQDRIRYLDVESGKITREIAIDGGVRSEERRVGKECRAR